MPNKAIDRKSNAEPVGSLDRWLRFDRETSVRYEAEQGRERVVALRSAIYVGLALYNAYNLTSLVLLPDIIWLSVGLRLLLVTPISLMLAIYIGSFPPRLREALILNALTGAYLIPVVLFWLTADPLGAFTFGEFSLTLIFGNMLLPLRFRHAVLFTCVAFAVTATAVFTKTGLDPTLQFAFLVQLATACVFSLYANHRTERRRCEDYLSRLGARLEAETAEAARKQFQDLSRTDALTGLPNRRLLNERMNEWFDDDRPAAVMMIDIDHFKLFNDVLGHPAGDDCLRSVSAVLADLAEGPGQICARFGGEEFTLVCQDMRDLDAARLAKRVVQTIEHLSIVHPGRSDGVAVVTVSVGVAFKPHGSAVTQAEIFAAADRALYQAKRRGRNCFILDQGVEPHSAHSA